MGRSVTVTGRGRVTAPYDQATLRLAVSSRAANPSDATARATYAMSAMREAVLGGGVEGSGLATTAVSLNPVHDPWPTVVGYEASLGLSVRIDDLGRVGTLLVAAIDAGGDGARVDGIAFGHRDAAGLEREARDAAYADALDKATQYAGLAGLVLGPVRRVEEAGARDEGSTRRLLSGSAAASAAVPVDPGEGVVTALVVVTWALGPSVA